MRPYCYSVLKPIICTATLIVCTASGNVRKELCALKRVIKAYRQNHTLSGSLVIARNYKILLSENFGYADIEKNLKNNRSTAFLIGSLSKQFTAVALLKLFEQGRINLHAPLSFYLAENHPLWQGSLPEWANTITVHHLLTHSAGLADYTQIPGFHDFYRTPHTTQELIQFFMHESTRFVAGTKYEYSGTGYNLLGALIEAVSGKPYAVFLQEQFFAPLRLCNTYSQHTTMLTHEQEKNPFLSKGYWPNGNKKLIPATEINLTTAFAEASIISTAMDLLKWHQALYEGNILKRTTLQLMLKPYYKTEQSDTGVGYGVFIATQQGMPIYANTGNINGYANIMLYEPSAKISVIILSNVADDALFPLAYDLLKTLTTRHGQQQR
jgi:CubicO group peptidase (beta-lactamase class C family)